MPLLFSRGPVRAAILVLIAAVGVRSAGAQTGADFLPVNPDPASYVVGPMPTHCLQTYRLFLPQPPHVMPVGGWPVVLDVRLNGFARSEDMPLLTADSLSGQLLTQGIAVITARVTPSILTTDSKYIGWCGAAPDIPGHGLFHPPGYVPPDLAAQGISPYEQPEYHMAEKDCVMLIQHVRYKARQTSNFDVPIDAALSSLDHRRIAVHGSSASAIALMWATMGPERNAELPFAGLPGQYAESSHPDIAVLDQGVVWWPAFTEDLQFPVSHFGSGGHSEIPAIYLGDTDPVELASASAFLYEDAATVGSLPQYLSYGEVSSSEEYDKRNSGCEPYPMCFKDQGQEGVAAVGDSEKNLHPAWSGYAWKNEHEDDPIRLVITDEDAYGQAEGVEAVPLYGNPQNQTPEQIQAMKDDDIVNWLLAEFDDLLDAQPTPEEEWWSLGNGLAGTDGVPQLSGQGAALPDAPVTVAVSGARPGAALAVIIGTTNWSIPMLGGVLVPGVGVGLYGMHHADASGSLVATTSWPASLPSGTALYFQVWIEDAAGPMGFSATNALELITP